MVGEKQETAYSPPPPPSKIGLKYEFIIYSFEAWGPGDFEYVITFKKYLNFAIYEHFKEFREICFANISAKFKYFAKQFILTESPDQML